jgi:hypothetical protein
MRALAAASRPAIRGFLVADPCVSGYRLARVSHRMTAIRALSTDPGFLDPSSVSERILEVVRKFEKVSLGYLSMVARGQSHLCFQTFSLAFRDF